MYNLQHLEFLASCPVMFNPMRTFLIMCIASDASSSPFSLFDGPWSPAAPPNTNAQAGSVLDILSSLAESSSDDDMPPPLVGDCADTHFPTPEPSRKPTTSPTHKPTLKPTRKWIRRPSASPTQWPTSMPTQSPTTPEPTQQWDRAPPRTKRKGKKRKIPKADPSLSDDELLEREIKKQQQSSNGSVKLYVLDDNTSSETTQLMLFQNTLLTQHPHDLIVVTNTEYIDQ